MRVKAAVLRQMGSPPPYARSKPLEIVDIDLAAPGRGEVLVKIEAAGLCHSDLSVIDGARPRPMPMVLGHEAAGVVEEIGDGVDDLAVGDHVVLVFIPSCGHCLPCATGRPALCEPGARANARGRAASRRAPADPRLRAGQSSPRRLGLRRIRGGFAGILVKVDPRPAVRARGVVRLRGADRRRRGGEHRARFPPARRWRSPGSAASACCGARRGRRRRASDRRRRSRAGRLAYALRARRDRRGRRRRARRRQARSRTFRRRGRVLFEMAGRRAGARTRLRRDGARRRHRHRRPAASRPQAVDPAVSLVAEERTLKGSYIGSCVPRRDLPNFVALFQAGRLPVDKLLTHRLRLDEINEGFDRLREGRRRAAGGDVLVRGERAVGSRQ